jgi:V8-like Glu-specific endopeptidase
MTAGHNIVRPAEGRAEKMDVYFPNGFTFTATGEELFVSEIYTASPTLSDRDPSSISDYALVAVDRSKHKQTPEQIMLGCALSVLPIRSELLHTGGTVYGYDFGNVLQSKETSPFFRPVQTRFLEYGKATHGGVSGGPIFVTHNGRDVAIGIQ